MLKDWKITFLGFNYSSLRLLVILILSLGTIFFFKSAIQYLFFPYDIIHLESYVVYILQRFVGGCPLEGNYCSFPLITNTYPPVFFLFSAFLARLMNLSSYFSILTLSRIITLSATLSCSVIIFCIARKIKYNTVTGIIASLLFLGNPDLFGWGYCGRVDMMGIMWSLLAIYVLLFEENRLSIYLAVLFSLLAFCTKQLYSSSIVTIIIYLALTCRLRNAIIVMLYFFFLVLFIFICLNYSSGGAAYISLILFPVAPFALSWLIKVLGSVWWMFLPLAILLAAAKNRLKNKFIVINIYAFTTIVIAVIASARIGADRNYWLEALAVISIIAAGSFDRLCAEKNKFLLCLVLPLLVFTYLRYGVAWLRGRLASDIEGHRPTKDLVVEMFKKAKGEVLYDSAPDVLINAGKPVDVCDWPSYEATLQKGICSNSLIEPKIENKAFDYIVFISGNKDNFSYFISPKTRELISANYISIQKTPDALIYIPKGNAE